MVKANTHDEPWTDDDTSLGMALELTSQKSRSALTQKFAEIVKQLCSSKEIWIYGSENDRRIETDRIKNLNKIQVRDMLQPIESAQTCNLSDIEGAVIAIEAQTRTILQLTKKRVRLLWPIQGRGGICNLLIVECDQKILNKRRELPGIVRLFENLLHIFDQAESDGLTGLLNRKAFDKAMENLLVKNIFDKGDPLGKKKLYFFAMLDIDHFKQINDKFGHLYGDEVLLNFARLLNQSFRRHDWIFRFGGEEFCIVLEVNEADKAALALERFRQAVENFNFPLVGKVTVSIGITQMNPGQNTSTIIDKADKALYHAKTHGRNRLVCFEDIFSESTLIDEFDEDHNITLF